MGIQSNVVASRTVSASRTDRLVRQCVHAIATGRWAAGRKLPSVREAERRWSVSRLTVLAAYRELERMGLVRAVDRSGYFVEGSPTVNRLSRHRVELRNLYERLDEQVAQEMGLSTLGTLRYLAELAEAEARERPECAFVECTAYEAGRFAGEVARRLGVPCMALTTGDIDGNRWRLPAHVRTLLTTSYHRAELKPLADAARVVLHEVAIEMSDELADELADRPARISLLGVDRLVLEDMARDLSERLEGAPGPMDIEQVPVERVGEALERRVGAPGEAADDRVVLLSPTLWEAAGPRRQAAGPVRPVRYQIREDALPGIADAIGLPLGMTH